MRSKPYSNQKRSETVRKPYRKVFHTIFCVPIAFPPVSEKSGKMLTKALSVLLLEVTTTLGWWRGHSWWKQKHNITTGD